MNEKSIEHLTICTTQPYNRSKRICIMIKLIKKTTLILTLGFSKEALLKNK